MTWTPIVGKGLTLAELQTHVDGLDFRTWKPSFMVLHNTGSPTLRDWHKTPGAVRMKNLENYFRNERGWPSGPHAFVADDLVWLFTPFTAKGTHSPSWNGVSLGIEMVGDFSIEDDETGAGLRVKNNPAALFGMLHAKLGLNPETIKLHKEDKKTTHDCPGKHIEKADFIERVQEYMGHGGDYALPAVPIAPVAGTHQVWFGSVNVPAKDVLNLRANSSASSPILARLPPGVDLRVSGEETNGSTKWLRVEAMGKAGWVSAQFVNRH
jgi:hypothetical protein